MDIGAALFSHEADVFNRGAAGSEAGGRFDEVDLRVGGDAAEFAFLGVVEIARFEDEFADAFAFTADGGEGVDIGEHRPVASGVDVSNVDDHVEFGCSAFNGVNRFRLSSHGGHLTKGEGDDGADGDIAAFE